MAGGGTGPTSPHQVVPQMTSQVTADNPTIRNLLTHHGSYGQQLATGLGRIQEVKMNGQAANVVVCNTTSQTANVFTAGGISNSSSSKKIILQPLAQTPNIILTRSGQPILLQATTQGR